MRYTKIILIIVCLLVANFIFAQRTTSTDNLKASTSVTIGDGSRNLSAILDIFSTTSGVRFPRMTETQRDNLATVEGLMIYNTDAKAYQYNNGVTWVDFGSGATVSDYIKVDSTNDIAGSTAALGSVIYNYETGATYKVQTNPVSGYATDSIAVAPVSGGYAVLKEMRDNERIDVRKLGIKSNTELTNDDLAILTKIENVKLYFPPDTFIFRNWQILDRDNIDIIFDNTVIKLPSSSSITVTDIVVTSNFDLPQIAITNCKNISIKGNVLVDHSDPTLNFTKAVGATEAMGAIHITVGTEFTDYKNIHLEGITTKESYYVPHKIKSPSAWVHYDSLSYKNINIIDCHSDNSASFALLRVNAGNINIYRSTAVIDRSKSITGASQETKALGVTQDVDAVSYINLHIDNFRSTYGGLGFYQNLMSVKIENSISDKWGYFPISDGVDGDLVTATWKAANPGLWDAATMIEFNGGQAVKCDNYYFREGRVFILDNIETRNTSTHDGTFSSDIKIEGGTENAMIINSTFDSETQFSSNPVLTEGVARKALLSNNVYLSNATLKIGRGAMINNCVFRDTVSTVSYGKQTETDTTHVGTFKAGVFVTVTGGYQRVRFNDCTFTNRGLYITQNCQVQINNCNFEGYSEINYGWLLTGRSQLIVKNSYGGRYRQSIAGTSDSLEIRFINHDRLGIQTTDFDNLQNSPLCEVTNSIIINYDSTETSDLITTIDEELTTRTKNQTTVVTEAVNIQAPVGVWGNTIYTNKSSSVSSGAFVIETDIPFTNATYIMLSGKFYRYYVTATKQIGTFQVGSYLASTPDFYNPQGVIVGTTGGTDNIRLAATAGNKVAIIIGNVGDSYGAYACHFIVDELKYTDDDYNFDLSTWTVKLDTDISEYTVKKTLTNTSLLSNTNSYAEMYIDDASPGTVVITSGTPGEVTAWTSGELNGFTYATGRLTYTGTTTKKFLINTSISFKFSDGNSIVESWLYKNGAAVTKSQMFRKISNGGDVGNGGQTVLVELAENDYIELFFDSNNNGTVTIESGNINIVQIN